MDHNKAEQIMSRVESLFKKTRRAEIIKTTVQVLLTIFLILAVAGMAVQVRELRANRKAVVEQNRLLAEQNQKLDAAIKIAEKGNR